MLRTATAITACLISTASIANDFVVKASPSWMRSAELGLHMQQAEQDAFNQSAIKCPTGFDIKRQSIRHEDGKGVLIWLISCSNDEVITPATPSSTAPAAPK